MKVELQKYAMELSIHNNWMGNSKHDTCDNREFRTTQTWEYESDPNSLLKLSPDSLVTSYVILDAD